MRKGKTYIVVAVLLVAIVGIDGRSPSAAGAATRPTTRAPAPRGAAAISGSAMERATAILGHAPTGLAMDIVDRGSSHRRQRLQLRAAELRRPGDQGDRGLRRRRRQGHGRDPRPRHRVGAPGLGDHPGRPADRPLRRLHRLHDHHARAPEGPSTSRDPYYYTSGQVFVKKGGTQITGADDLAGKKVGVGAATTYYDYLKKNTRPTSRRTRPTPTPSRTCSTATSTS